MDVVNRAAHGDAPGSEGESATMSEMLIRLRTGWPGLPVAPWMGATGDLGGPRDPGPVAYLKYRLSLIWSQSQTTCCNCSS